MRAPHHHAGFTLIEMIVVIVITGIIGGMVAMFIRAPVQQYMDVSRRAELTDVADTALYRMAGDISTAVPNSIRVAGCGATPCMEFLPTKNGGLYRANAVGGTGGCGAAGDELNFGLADSCFEIIGPPIDFVTGPPADQIVLGSTQSDGDPPYNTTAAGILRAYTGAAGPQSAVSFTATQFPAFAELPSHRFDVVDGAQQAVTYACVALGGGACAVAGGNGTCQLMRYWGYGFHVAQQAPGIIATNTAPVAAHAEAVLADRVSGCTIDYNPVNQRMGLLAIHLTLTSGGESVSLYHEIHVNNAP